jgi:hypothetical protein
MALATWLSLQTGNEWDRQMAWDFAPGGRGVHVIEKVKADIRLKPAGGLLERPHQRCVSGRLSANISVGHGQVDPKRRLTKVKLDHAGIENCEETQCPNGPACQIRYWIENESSLN